MLHDLGLLAARLTIGLSYASHGTQKAFGWFEGPGPEGSAKFMESLGFKPGETYAQAASYNEIAAGLMIATGLGGPIGPPSPSAISNPAAISLYDAACAYVSPGLNPKLSMNLAAPSGPGPSNQPKAFCVPCDA